MIHHCPAQGSADHSPAPGFLDKVSLAHSRPILQMPLHYEARAQADCVARTSSHTTAGPFQEVR